MAKSIWWNILAWTKLPINLPFISIAEALECIDNQSGSFTWKKIIKVVFQTTMWHIWKARNDKEFNGIQKTGGKVVEEIKADTFLWLKPRSKFSNIVWERWENFNVTDIVS
ncbi:hypothetical protein HanRHA438_Chr13g0596691 [Helianthus annuus]|nr:hypothetical protein HanHA300_Chr13g0480391 [Helianthus annuus]KAJ0481022.1 hypothetical protein HanIR_Chr13g0638081 [Helianthus annuus]KAJ0497540.1 hypothetical protein HanHA89_Chr13g0512471 [Helianthus annuus]KAJ0671048.1 hypothetical protein HanOQP8_Chr13g0481331 [Helianthus annuus]KAJ0858030.1 hypothetical protein HanRHA438_Chr13g0596691 [Helianthus annuus]